MTRLSEDKPVEIVPDSSEQVDATPVIEGKTSIRQFRISASFVPLPHPDDLAKYETILPGTADRILTLAEKEQKNRHAVELKEIEAKIKAEENKSSLINMTVSAKDGEVKIVGRGQTTFIILLVSLIISTVLCAVFDKTLFAGLFFAAFAIVYLYSSGILGKDKKNNQSKESAAD